MWDNLNSQYWQNKDCKIYRGNVFEELRKLSDESVDCVITSPPYWALRDYQLEPQIWDGDEKCEHRWGRNNIKHLRGKSSNAIVGNNLPDFEGLMLQKDNGNFCSLCGAWRGSLGLEPTFELYLEHLLQIFDEIKRALKKTGTCWVNLGDSYSGMKIGKTDKKVADYVKDSQKNLIKNCKEVPSKSLCLIPQRFAIGMVDRGWILRNQIIWYKRNCMPSSVKDRFTVDYEPIFFFVKNKKYWFEQQYEEYKGPLNRWGGDYFNYRVRDAKRKVEYCPQFKATKEELEKYAKSQKAFLRDRDMRPNKLGRNRRCVWDIPTQPFKGSHFAVFPETLVRPMIKSGCPEFICRSCGKAREKIETIIYGDKLKYSEWRKNAKGKHKGMSPTNNSLGYGSAVFAYYKEVWGMDAHNGLNLPKKEIYTDCNCNVGWTSGIVLDPFAGAGTTGVVAQKLGRKFIGIELSQKYVDEIMIPRLKREEVLI